MALKEEIKEIAGSIKDKIIAKRRFLHQNPELSFLEFKTSDCIKESLDEIGIPWVPIAGTGILATIEGEDPCGKVIALRADMDALPIFEENDVDYKSRNDGVMHACGHDVHVSSLLGAAEILHRLKTKFRGTIKLIFQPAEEVLPGGAIKVIKEGALVNPNVDAIIGQHVMPRLASGKIGVRKGRFMASMDEIRIVITGKGGHGAEPHKSLDPVVVASTVIVSLQQVVSRNNNPVTPSVLSFGKIQSNGSCNIIPDKVFIEGTFRTMDEQWRKEAHKKIEHITASIAEGCGCGSIIDIKKGYPCLYNNEILTDKIRLLMEDFMGVNNVVENDIWMASEDFAYYSQEIDSCFYLLGTGYPDKNNPSLHTSLFHVDENSIETGMGLMCYIALNYLA